MKKTRHARAGFTLIELLVVIAILALLLAMLMPALSRAKDIAKRVQCQTNFKLMGSSIMVFAAAHKDRGPGHAMYPGDSDITDFAGVLLKEHFLPMPIQASGPPQKHTIYCPSVAGDRWDYSAIDAIKVNENFEPEHDHPHINADGTPYGNQCILRGAWVNPPPAGCQWYVLGPRLMDVTKAGYKFAFWESACGGYGINYMTGPRIPFDNSDPLGTGWIKLDTSGAYPAYSWSNYGYFAFRHVLPRDSKQWQTTATGCYLFFDGHVEVMTPMARINVAERFDIVGG